MSRRALLGMLLVLVGCQSDPPPEPAVRPNAAPPPSPTAPAPRQPLVAYRAPLAARGPGLLDTARALATLGDPAALPSLRTLAADPSADVRAAAVLGLARLPTSPGRDAALLSAHAAHPSTTSLAALGAVESADAVMPLVRALSTEPDSACHALARRARRGARLPADAYHALVQRLQRDEAPVSCWRAALSTPVPFGVDAALLTAPVSDALAPSRSAPVRAVAASGLARVPVPLALLASLARDPLPPVHQAAHMALLAKEDADADAALIAALDGPGWRSAARHLRRRAHVTRVYEALRARQPPTEQACAHAELLDTARAWPNLVLQRCEGLPRAHAELRILASGTGADNVRAVRLRALTDHSDPEVRRRAHGYLRRLGEERTGADPCEGVAPAPLGEAVTTALAAGDFPRVWRCAAQLQAVAADHAALAPLGAHRVRALRELGLPADVHPWPPAPESPGRVRLRVRTTEGDALLELDGDRHPRSVARVLAWPGAFVGPAVVLPTGVRLPAQEPAVPALPSEETQEAITRGDIFMALREDQRDSAALAMVVTTAPRPELRDTHTRVGRVVSGLEVFERWADESRVLEVSRETSP